MKRVRLILVALMIITALSVGACSQDQKAGNGEKSGQSVGNSEKNIETDIQNGVRRKTSRENIKVIYS